MLYKVIKNEKLCKLKLVKTKEYRIRFVVQTQLKRVNFDTKTVVNTTCTNKIFHQTQNSCNTEPSVLVPYHGMLDNLISS